MKHRQLDACRQPDKKTLLTAGEKYLVPASAIAKVVALSLSMPQDGVAELCLFQYVAHFWGWTRLWGLIIIIQSFEE